MPILKAAPDRRPSALIPKGLATLEKRARIKISALWRGFRGAYDGGAGAAPAVAFISPCPFEKPAINQNNQVFTVTSSAFPDRAARGFVRDVSRAR